MGIFSNLFKGKAIKVEAITFSQGASDIDVDACTFEVVGESFQRDHLVALLKKHGVLRDGRFPTPAILELEPTNDFDPTAVKVMVEGMQVGYIPKHLSGDVTKALRDQGVKEYTVDAVLGWDSDSPMPLIGVKLDMSEFGL
jgi:hypothetical protein